MQTQPSTDRNVAPAASLTQDPRLGFLRPEAEAERLLILDQMEEIFTSTADPKRERFLDVLLAAVDYGETTPSRLVPEMVPRKMTLCEDETFHPASCLVGIEPVSDFSVLETDAEQRDAKTWNAAVSKALAGLPVGVIQSTSDEGKGL